MRPTLRYLPIALAVLALTGCTQTPEQQINNARAAIDAARDAQAELYATDLFLAAGASLDSATTEIRRQEKRIVVRDYARARELLQKALELANEARLSVDAGKNKMRSETDSLLAKAEGAVKEMTKAFDAAKRKKRDLQNAKPLVDEAISELRKAGDALANGTVAGAHAHVKAALAKAAAARDSIMHAPARPRRSAT